MKVQICFSLFILSLIHQQECSKVSSNPIYEILTRGSSKTCYTCDGDCVLPARIHCAGTSRCFSNTTRASNNQTVGYKGCLDGNFENFCDDVSGEDSSCYVCTDSLCNREEVPEAAVPFDLGTNECYYCLEECARPTGRHTCQEVLTPIEGRVVKAACFLFQITKEESVEMYKGCLEDDPEVRSTCLMANLFMPEIRCNICGTDMCNGDQEDEELFPEECYYCDGSCETQEVHNCKEVLGQETWAKCVAIDYQNDQNQRIVESRCAVVDATFQTQCDLINAQGGNCTICHTNLCNKIEDSSGKTEELQFSIMLLLITIFASRYV